MNDTPETRALLVKGKLEQICPAACRNGWRRKTQTAEAASRRCSACGTPTGPAAWFRPVATEAQAGVLAAIRAKRHLAAEVRSQLAETAAVTSPGARQGARASQAPRLSNRTRPLPATTAAAGRHPG